MTATPCTPCHLALGLVAAPALLWATLRAWDRWELRREDERYARKHEKVIPWLRETR
jgi:hypothetical protein